MTTAPLEPPAPDQFTFIRKKHLWRWVAGIVVVALVAALVYSIATNPRFGWPIVAEFFFSPAVVAGIGITLFLTVVSMIIGVLLGLLLAVMRLSHNPVVSQVAHGYVALFRGTPVLVQLLIWFNLAALYPVISFGIPGVALNANQLITPLLAGILGLGLNEAAYMSEIIRAGIISVPSGQHEAASALGLNRRQGMAKVILPQAMRVIIPPTGNEFIGMLKSTSLVSVLSVADLLYSAQIIYSQNLQVIPLLMVASIWYIILTTIFNFGQGYVERYYGRGSGPSTQKTVWSRIRKIFQTHAPEALTPLKDTRS
ncbi:polar amino acid transport system permease protein [Leifsonia sp. EB41]|uniref:amino acid ABC transporter permease n=1 Tax=Leifsonia sp. EB41 TaxID=3156260 RepID=UPI003511DF3E